MFQIADGRHLTKGNCRLFCQKRLFIGRLFYGRTMWFILIGNLEGNTDLRVTIARNLCSPDVYISHELNYDVESYISHWVFFL